MQLLSSTMIVMIGETPQGLPFPQFFPGWCRQASFLAVSNIGPCDVTIAVGPTAGVALSAETGALVAAGSYAGQPARLQSLDAIATGSFITIAIQPGDLFFGAVALPTQIGVWHNGTAASDSTTVTLDSATDVAVGQSVSGDGVASGTGVTNVDGTTITISLATTAELSETPLQFAAAPAVQPPGILAVALGA
jgi:hypothetical protein